MLFPTTARAIKATVLGFVLSSAGFGQEAASTGQARDGRRLFEEVVKVYRSSSAYADEGVLRTEFVQIPKRDGDKPRIESVKARLAFARPNKLALSFGFVRILCDGNEMVTVIDGYKRYFVTKAPKEITLETFRPKRMQNLLSADIDGFYIPYVLTLLLGRRPASEFFDPPDHVILVVEDRLINGKEYVCLKPVGRNFGELRSLTAREEGLSLLIDPVSKRLIGLELEHELPEFPFGALPPPTLGLPPELQLTPLELQNLMGDLPGLPSFAECATKKTWTSGPVSDHLPPISVFEFQRREITSE